MDSNNQTIKASQDRQEVTQPLLKLIACISIIYALLFEYLHWINHQEGMISEWLNFPFTFTAHPFIILFFLSLGSFIPNYFHHFIQKKIAQSGSLVREKAYKAAEIAKFFYIIFLVAIFFYSYSYIQSNVSEGICNNFFTCSAAFTLEKVHGIFALIYLVILQFGFFINNLPQTQSIPFSDRGIVVLDKEEGLYGLQPGQFVFIHTLGESTKYDIFPSNSRTIKGYRLYKSLRQRWFVVSEDFFYLKNDLLTINLDLWTLECRYEARICDRNIIDRNQINLSVLESLDQLQSKIEADCIKKFRKEITSNFLYRRAEQELEALYRDIDSMPLNLAERSRIYARLIAITSQIGKLGSQLQNSSELTVYLYGKLFEVNFQITNVTATEKQKHDIIECFDLVIKNDEMTNKNISQLTSLLHKLEGYIDPTQVSFLINKLMKLCGISELPSKDQIDDLDSLKSKAKEPDDYFYT